MSTIREHLYLAALLHDIGKFYQRADTGSVASSKVLGEVVRGLEDYLLPRNAAGVYTHKHALWTAQFIEENREVFQQLASGVLGDLTDRDNLINLAGGHHLPFDKQSSLGRILKKADHLSSGMDRETEAAFKDDQDESAWDSFKRKRQVAILQNIMGHEDSARVYHQPLTDVKLEQSYFPRTFFKEEAPDYAQLWSRFNADFKYIQANTYHAFAETLLNLLFKYATTIPASTINFPDVSLYDHLKTTAALAVSLYDYEQEKEEAKSENAFLLIGADFSGIQSYIYQVISKYANKNLKGRSFYLKILSDAVVRYLLKELNLFQANVVYNSGGGFFLLAPNTVEVKAKLRKAVDAIEAHLLRAHGTSLFVAIDYVEMGEDELMHLDKEHNLREVWKTLFEKRDKKKQCRFASLLEEDYQRFFTPFIYAEGKRDAITGELFSDGEKLIPFMDGKFVRELTDKQIKLGKNLRESEVMVVSEGEIAYWRDKDSIAPADLGIYYYLLNYADIEAMKMELRASADKVTVVSLNGKMLDCDFMRSMDGANNIYALEFYGGNIYSERTFDQMCERKSDEEFSRFAILRMDVDNLGTIFQRGIATERATLSRYAALSRSFDYFFSGYLNRIQQDEAPLQSAIVYSGGDDVFIVGDWLAVLRIAKRIREDFKAYTCYNPYFSLSGGMAMVVSGFPLIKGAAISGDEEAAAKKHTYEKGGRTYQKNAFSFMGMPLNWDNEFPAVEQLKDTLVELLEQRELPKSFLSKVMMSAQNAGFENHAVRNMKMYWMLTYDLGRMKKTLGAKGQSLLDNCIKEVCGKNNTLNGNLVVTAYHPLELWNFAARWAELQYRSNKNINQ